MTKSNRHKKERKKEKAKTQLTGVKRLSKAKNVVEPTLRVKKILIREQLKSSSLPPLALAKGKDGSDIDEADEGVTKWKQSIQDLLVSSNHHNVNIRKDAIVGLQEIAQSKSLNVIRNLDKLLAKIAALTSDPENLVRKENLKLAGIVIAMISDDQLTPFWSMLIAHLKCTMTHLDLTVRYSTLSFVELLVDHHPLLVYESSSVLLPSLLGLISTTYKPNASDKNTRKSKHLTTLKTEITGKHDDVTVRIKVLRLLSKCLKISSARPEVPANEIVHQRTSENSSQYLALQYSFGYYGGQSEKIYSSGDFSNSNGSYADRLYSTVTADPYISVFNYNISDKKSSNIWKEFVNSCVPVLIETWVEVGPYSEKKTDQSKNSKGGNKTKQQSSFVQLGNDEDSNESMDRRNGLHILNETHVENMLSTVILLEQLLQPNGSNVQEQSLLAKDIKITHGSNLLKYFFGLMPYDSLKDSRREDVIAINLKLFLIAGKLNMFDNHLKKKLQIFVEGVAGSRRLKEDHCKLILDVIRFLDIKKVGTLPTDFLISASKVGYHRVIAEYLIGFIHPANYQLQKQKNLLDAMAAFEWNEIVKGLVNSWPVSSKPKKDEEVKYLFELLTFIALRRLTDVNSLVLSSIPKLKELITGSEMQTVWDSAHRAFVYADAEDIFENELAVHKPQ